MVRRYLSKSKIIYSLLKKLVAYSIKHHLYPIFPDCLSITENLTGGIRIKSQKNTDEYRTGIITIREDNASALIYVSQAGLCNICHGKGEVSCSGCLGMGGLGYGIYYMPCMVCRGDGKIQCATCSGLGKRE